MFQPKMIENEKSFQCIHGHNLPIVKVATNANLSKDRRLLCDQCFKNNIIDSNFVEYEEIAKIIKNEQNFKMNLIENIITTNIQWIESLISNVNTLKQNLISQLDSLTSILNDWISNLEYKGLQYSKYSFIDQLDLMIKNQNMKFDSKNLINDIFSDYTKWKPKVISVLEQFKKFEKVNECKKILSKMNFEIQKQMTNNSNEKPQDIIEGLIDLRQFCNINTWVSNLILSPNEQYLAVIIEQQAHDDYGYIQHYLVIIFNLTNNERIYQGQWIIFDQNEDNFIEFQFDQNSKYFIDKRAFNIRIVKIESINNEEILFYGNFLDIDNNQNLYMNNNNQVKVYSITPNVLLKTYYFDEKLVWFKQISGFAFIIQKQYFQIILFQNMKQIKIKKILLTMGIIKLYSPKIIFGQRNKQWIWETRNNKIIRRFRHKQCLLFQNGFEAQVSWIENNRIVKFDLLKGTQKFIDFSNENINQCYAIAKKTIVVMMNKQKLKYQKMI
ncbi:unnamed protein product [Paramecium sonneborni]|uniref:Uncharacterized protein n=1 Tax=Paramecium sonneborni TaxID=65129 RepID=A0A8S1Q754_9CILI|nr:unnamed protein product [Paramecium sonneborni]